MNYNINNSYTGWAYNINCINIKLNQETAFYVSGFGYFTKEGFEKYFDICKHCGDAYRKYGDAFEKYISLPEDGKGLCNNCLDEKYKYCDGHKMWEPTDGNKEYYYILYTGYVCKEFYKENIVTCEICGNRTIKSELREKNGMIMCECCYETLKNGYEDFSGLSEYHDTPFALKANFLDSENRFKNPHIGFELEVEVADESIERYDAVSCADNYLNGGTRDPRFVFETDGSLDYGFECISRPASLKYWVDNFSNIEQACKYLTREYGCRSHSSGHCGLHVHIDRKYFGISQTSRELAEAKFLWLFEKHWENLVKFSRRRSFGYCHKLEKSGRTIPNIIKTDKGCAEGHYTAVNIGNTGTIELRLWRGTLNPKTIKATLKFSIRLAELVKHKTVNELNKMSFEEILGDDPDILAYWETVKNRT